MDNYRVGIDVGSEKTAMVVVEPGASGEPDRVLGFSTVPTVGVRRHGVISSLAELADTVENARNKAVDSSERLIGRVNCCLSGNFFRFGSRNAEIEVARKDAGVTRGDIDCLFEKLCQNGTEDGFRLLHFLCQEYILDHTRNIVDPLDQLGDMLGLRAFLVEAFSNNLKNFERCLNSARLEVADFSYAPLAAAQAVLSPEEIEAGVVYLDLGSSVTTIILFNNTLAGIETCDLGGYLVTRFLAEKIKTVTEEAKNIIREFGTCRPDVEPEEIQLYNLQGENVGTTTRLEVARVLNAEYAKRLAPRLKSILEQYGLRPGGGLVLGGGGASLDGLPELFGEKLNLPVRVGRVNGFTGWERQVADPRFHAVLGCVNQRCDRQPACPGGGRSRFPFLEPAWRAAGKARAYLKNLYQKKI